MDWQNILKEAKSKDEIIKILENIKFYPTFKEVEGNKYAVVVIPTKEVNGKWAKADLEIFKGLHIIFVVDGKGTFKISQAINKGVEKALKYNPKWIIISNDDMYKIDDIKKLISELKKSEDYDTLFFPKSNTYSNGTVVAKPFLQKYIRYVRMGWRKEYQKIVDRLGIKYELLDFKDHGFMYSNLAYKKNLFIKIPNHQGSFIILNAKYVRNVLKGKIFDEIFYNGHEDTYLCYRYLNNSRYKFSNFNIGTYIGKSLGTGINRAFWELANEVYFEYLIRELVHPTKKQNSKA